VTSETFLAGPVLDERRMTEAVDGDLVVPRADEE